VPEKKQRELGDWHGSWFGETLRESANTGGPRNRVGKTGNAAKAWRILGTKGRTALRSPKKRPKSGLRALLGTPPTYRSPTTNQGGYLSNTKRGGGKKNEEGKGA